MSDLTDFLRARLDEDERAATKATAGPWKWSDISDTVRTDSSFGSAIASIKNSGHDGPHIARHDPARVLRKVEANRATLAWLLDVKRVAAEHIPDEAYAFADGLADKALAHLAAEYADHPDYRQEWTR